MHNKPSERKSHTQDVSATPERDISIWVARRTSKDYDYYYYSKADSAQALPLSLSHGHAAANVHGGG
jgi:hypothetical protein